MNEQGILLSLEDVRIHFPVKKGVFKRTVGYVKAVDGIDLDIYRGETLGLVGESGCGKTTLGKGIMQLIKHICGSIVYHDQDKSTDLIGLSDKEMQPFRKKLQIVFQDPFSSLNPSFTVFGSLQDPLKKYGIASREERRKIIGDLLESVNMDPDAMDLYPSEFSGGQRQRIGIARALSVGPELIVCDEAVSALDVSIQAQVLKLLKAIKEERNLTYIFISHDLSVVEYISDRIAVMYLGKIVELAESEELYAKPLHPYTQALLSAIPKVNQDKKGKRIVLEGDVPNPVDPPTGCAFHPRCKACFERCRVETPVLTKYRIDGKDHFVACHLMENNPKGERI